MKVIIVGGVAGGASCAARLRRLDEKAEIIMVERGPYVSYANCGLPYHVGGVIPKESSLLVASEQTVPRSVRDRRADELRGHRHLAEEEDGRTARTSRPARSRPSPTTSWCCRPARPRSIRRCPASTCPASSTCGPCRTPNDPRVDRSAARRSSPGCITTRAFRFVKPTAAPSSLAADSSDSRWPRTWSISAST